MAPGDRPGQGPIEARRGRSPVQGGALASDGGDSMARVFIMYRLRRGVSREQYRRWSREVDQVVASRQPGVLSYRVFEVTGSGKGDAPCDILEDIEVESREAWEKVNDYPEMKPVVKEWLELCDPDSVSVLYVEAV